MAWTIAIYKEDTNDVDINKVMIVNEFLDIFLEELQGLFPDQKVKFTIDLVPSIKLISMPPH